MSQLSALQIAIDVIFTIACLAYSHIDGASEIFLTNHASL
jgi:uncharacterized alkaline shock family protein YloU